jgi:hypothetical protein
VRVRFPSFLITILSFSSANGLRGSYPSASRAVTSTMPRAALPRSIGQDVVYEAQPVVSRAEVRDVISTSPCCCIPSGVLRPFTSVRCGLGSNINHWHSRRNDVNNAAGDLSTRAGQVPSQAVAHTRLYFPRIVEIPMT